MPSFLRLLSGRLLFHLMTSPTETGGRNSINLAHHQFSLKNTILFERKTPPQSEPIQYAHKADRQTKLQGLAGDSNFCRNSTAVEMNFITTSFLVFPFTAKGITIQPKTSGSELSLISHSFLIIHELQKELSPNKSSCLQTLSSLGPKIKGSVI